MSDKDIVDAVLGASQIPHQPFVVIVDSAVFAGLAVFRESLQRALHRGGPVLLVAALHGPSRLPRGHATVVELGVPGYQKPEEHVVKTVSAAYERLGPGAQVFIDAIDIVGEDYSPHVALQLVRTLLRQIKASKPPSRLTLLLPHTASLLQSLVAPTLSATLTLVNPYHPSVLTHLSKSYLLPIDSSPPFWTVLDRARDRTLPETLAYGGLEGAEVTGDWSSRGAIVTVLVRKATGGTKGISRALAALVPAEHGGLKAADASALVNVSPLIAPSAGGPVDKPPTTHVELDLPFNLSLTDEQKRRRGEVPLPYAHEGEGVGIEFGEEDDDEDED